MSRKKDEDKRMRPPGGHSGADQNNAKAQPLTNPKQKKSEKCKV